MAGILGAVVLAIEPCGQSAITCINCRTCAFQGVQFKLRGGDHADVFRFTDVSESTIHYRDTILDFEKGIDVVELTDIDAINGGGDNAFSFIGKNAFSGTAGELRYWYNADKKVTVINGDTNGDGATDLAINMSGNVTLGASDFDL